MNCLTRSLHAAALVLLALQPAGAAAQTVISTILPERLEELQGDTTRQSLLARCVGANAVLARRAEKLGEVEQMATYRERAQYWIAVAEAGFGDRAQTGIEAGIDYWMKKVDAQGMDATLLMLETTSGVTCIALKNRLEGKD